MQRQASQRALTHLQSYTANRSVAPATFVEAPRRFYELQRLHVYDQGGRNSLSGINATLFGGSSALGVATGSALGRIGSTLVLPHRKMAGSMENRYKEVKSTVDLGYKSYLKL